MVNLNELANLTDEQLHQQIKAKLKINGPITDTTRSIYIQKLKDLQLNAAQSPPIKPQRPIITPKAAAKRPKTTLSASKPVLKEGKGKCVVA